MEAESHENRAIVPPTPVGPQSPDLSALNEPRMTTAQQVWLSLYWFASSAHWGAILVFLLPAAAKAIGGGGEKGTTLGIIFSAGALVAMLAAPIFGTWSDRVRVRWGRRRPFMVAGAVGNALCLLWLASVPLLPGNLAPYLVAFCAVQLFNNMATAPYAALIPDVVPVAQRGSASGWMGLMTMLGTAAGGGIAMLESSLGIMAVYGILAGIILLGMTLSVLFVQEPAPTAPPPFHFGKMLRGLITPFRSADFAWVFWTRFMVVLGTYMVQEFLKYFMDDVVARGNPSFTYRFFGMALATESSGATFYFIVTLLIGAILSALAAGNLSDRYGRKLMVYISGGLQALVALVILLSGSFEIIVMMGLIFGLGYGAYQSVDWALASDVLPNKEDFAKDMGVWHIALTLPQVLGILVAGPMLDVAQNYQRDVLHVAHPTLGYWIIFPLAFLFFLLGTLLVRNVKGAR